MIALGVCVLATLFLVGALLAVCALGFMVMSGDVARTGHRW